ncbi:hypothetical protein EU803_05570 [Loktanella sp. IMCC34160]|uniref:hypothetical protein n=1 Tax=Loktanella sp. IMCC34160 TaxID=2510646 RepID=UPI00101D307C|nr:hypothetical protein [Loktanella sp. IMCC34160]RYG91920.1 hypothetical protein EU803_05570 [Loktanella sp. IMCC34160]
MKGDVVDMEGRPRRDPAPVSDFWFAQMDVRLGKIEFVVGRLEKQVWLIVCAAFALVGIEVVAALVGGN